MLWYKATWFSLRALVSITNVQYKSCYKYDNQQQCTYAWNHYNDSSWTQSWTRKIHIACVGKKIILSTLDWLFFIVDIICHCTEILKNVIVFKGNSMKTIYQKLMTANLYFNWKINISPLLELSLDSSSEMTHDKVRKFILAHYIFDLFISRMLSIKYSEMYIYTYIIYTLINLLFLH